MVHVLLWLLRLGVRYFTRKGVPRWNQPGPPFQARTKAGDVNAWPDALESVGHDHESFVQLDVDHRPRPEYLDRTLGQFADPAVVWVQAPSVSSELDSWTSRRAGRAGRRAPGPSADGFYGHSGAPVIIGSHTSYRTAAVQAIGGFRSTRAADHLDTVALAAASYAYVRSRPPARGWEIPMSERERSITIVRTAA